MKTRLNVTIEQSLLNQIKAYAAAEQISISQLIQSYFEHLLKPRSGQPTIMDLVENLPPAKSTGDGEKDLVKAFYEEKYGE